MLNSDSSRAGKAFLLVAGDQMVAQLLHATSIESLEDIDAYVCAIESIVAELLTRHVDNESRGAVRAAYKAGIAAGLYGANSEAEVDVEPDMVEDGRSSALLKMIMHEGWEHGRTISHWVMLRYAKGALSNPDVSQSMEFRGAAIDFL
ncbi:hypothetical protein [Burkholderia ubonensis]|uniref:hypothetical protein n=1 Tax=Burkholderia ubonensis TaxID=101571 RepID=UPI000A494385|nr:hypothetical protein [Burkholderia ubonensis]